MYLIDLKFARGHLILPLKNVTV